MEFHMESDPKKVFADNLKRARAIRCITLKQLVQKVRQVDGSISPASLSYYENGKRYPSSAHLLALARALDLPMDFFANPVVSPLEPQALSFRKLASTRKCVQESVAAQAQDALRRWREAMALSETGIPQVTKYRPMAIRTPEDAEAAACSLREDWNLGVDPISDVVSLLERNGIVVLSFAMPPSVSGFCGKWEDISFVGFNSIHPAFRRRSTLLHEVSHLLFDCEDEKLAQRFAGAFLLPSESFLEMWGAVRRRYPYDEELLGLKKTFGASMSSIVLRASQLGRLSASQARWFFIRHPRKAPEPGDDSKEFLEVPVLFRLRVFSLLREERITLSKGAALLGEPIGSLRASLAAK